MDRRECFQLAVAGAAAAALPVRRLAAEEQAPRAVRGLPSPIIKDIKVITTQPSGVRLVVVKILTDQDGLYGYGCATFTQRADLVAPAVEKYLKPLLLGKPAHRIEDTWQACYNSSYWRNGPVLNNAISGVDEALWDIKGRQANMPVYQLLGGNAREPILPTPPWRHDSTRTSSIASAKSWRRGFDVSKFRSACPVWPRMARVLAPHQ